MKSLLYCALRSILEPVFEMLPTARWQRFMLIFFHRNSTRQPHWLGRTTGLRLGIGQPGRIKHAYSPHTATTHFKTIWKKTLQIHQSRHITKSLTANRLIQLNNEKSIFWPSDATLFAVLSLSLGSKTFVNITRKNCHFFKI